MYVKRMSESNTNPKTRLDYIRIIIRGLPITTLEAACGSVCQTNNIDRALDTGRVSGRFMLQYCNTAKHSAVNSYFDNMLQYSRIRPHSGISVLSYSARCFHYLTTNVA